jgi:hypothetical protein
MKKFLFSLALSIFCIGLNAQECKGFYYLGAGKVEMTMYDKKGKESGKGVYTISNVKKSGGTTTADFTSEISDEKGKSLSKGSGKYKCSGGILYIDAKVAMPQDQMSMYKDMDIKAPEVFIEYPSTLSSGLALKDANFKMEVYNKGALYSTTTFDQVNRKVEGKETIITPAGTFECWKITYDGKFKATMAPMNIGIPFNFKGTEWFAPGFGIVKTETYNKNGKILGSTLITKTSG